MNAGTAYTVKHIQKGLTLLAVIMSTTGRWASATVSWLVDLLHDIVKGPIK